MVVDTETSKVDEEICKKFDLTLEELSEMIDTYQKEPEVAEMQGLMEENTKRIFEEKRPDFKLDYPDKITSELYFEILTTIFEFIRYEAYWRLRYKIRENNGST